MHADREWGRGAGMSATSGRASPMEAFHRTRGRGLCAHLGGQFWAGSVHIWAKGLEPKLLTTACYTFSI
jgi:hypothetical protein